MNASETSLTSSKALHDQRDSFSILFLGFSREKAAATQASLQSVNLLPRCRIISNERELSGSLAERSWDLLLLSNMNTQDLSFGRAAEVLKELNKDIPILLLCEKMPDPEAHLAMLEAGIQVALTENNEKLNVMYIYQSLRAVKQRKHWRYCESLLEKAEHRITELIDDSRTAICFIRDNLVCYANERFYELLGYGNLKDLSGLNLDRFIASNCKDTFLNEINKILQGQKQSIHLGADILRADTTRFHATLTLNPAVFNEQDAIQVDIVQQLSETEIFSEIDPISGLLNQSGFAKQLEQQLELARKGGNDGFLFYITLDAYDTILHNLGQEGIDLLVQSTGKQLKSLVNQAHTLARIDENIFTLLLADPQQDTAKALAREICIAISEMDTLLGDYRIQTTCSIGITIINESTPRGTELLLRAEQAAKSLHLNDRIGNGYSFYQIEQTKPVVSNDAAAVKRVVDAITNNHFRLLFQPIVPLDPDVKLANYEIFLRLITEDDKEVSPTVFMSSIADDNVLARMDMWVLEECIMLMRQSLDQGKRHRLFINVTGKTLRNKSLLPWFAEQLRSLRLPADHFVFEISEVDALAAPAYYKAFCKALHKLHCRICLKHFGSTSESNYVIADAKVDFVKLDSSYLKEMNRNSLSPKQMAQMIQPLKEKGIELIAPMVEDTAQMRQLFRMGINMVQGHYLQPPQPEMQYDFFNQ